MNVNCEYREILCQNDCGVKFQKRFLQKHLDKDCPKKIIACPFCDDRHMREDKKVSSVAKTSAHVALLAYLVEDQSAGGRVFESRSDYKPGSLDNWYDHVGCAQTPYLSSFLGGDAVGLFSHSHAFLT